MSSLRAKEITFRTTRGAQIGVRNLELNVQVGLSRWAAIQKRKRYAHRLCDKSKSTCKLDVSLRRGNFDKHLSIYSLIVVGG